MLIFVFAKTRREALGPTRPSIEYREFLLRRKNGRSVRMATHSRLVRGYECVLEWPDYRIAFLLFCLYNSNSHINVLHRHPQLHFVMRSSEQCNKITNESLYCYISVQERRKCHGPVACTTFLSWNVHCFVLSSGLAFSPHTNNLPVAAVGRGVRPSCRSGGHPCRLPRALVCEKRI